MEENKMEVTCGTEHAKEGLCCHQKATPREEKGIKLLKNRLSRMTGQLNGIAKILWGYPDSGGGGGKCASGFWLSCIAGAYGHLCGGGNTERESWGGGRNSGVSKKIKIIEIKGKVYNYGKTV